MSSLSKFSAILFALLLTCVGIGGERHEAILSAAFEVSLAVEDAEMQLSEKSLTDAFALHQQAETLVNAPSLLPAPGSKIQAKHYLSVFSAIERKIQCIVWDYLTLARSICPSQSIAVIIFPFHYFL